MAQPLEQQDSYRIKHVPFLGRTDVPIMCQSVNGPCPLLAVANVLSLRGELSGIPRGASEVSADTLLGAVAERILERAAALSAQPAPAVEANVRANVNDCLEVLQQFNQGVDVNPRFDHPLSFEPTREVAVFDLLGIHLVHGWLVDPQDAETARCLASRSYNQVVELLVASMDSGGVPAVRSGSSTAAPPPPPPAPPAPPVPDLLGDEVVLEPVAGLPPALPPPSQPPGTPDAGGAEHDGDDVLQDLASVVQASPASDPRGAAVADGAAADEAAAPPAAPSPLPAATAAVDIDDIFSGLAVHTDAPPTPPVSRAIPLPAPGASGEEAAMASPSPSIVARTHQALVAKAFLEAHASQLTVYGISQIAATLDETALAVFFRNNHFNCLFKHGRALFLLCTDQGYLGVPEVVWERLDTVDGDTQLCGPDFLPHKARAPAPPPSDVDLQALAHIPPGALAGLSEEDAAAIAEAAGMVHPSEQARSRPSTNSGSAEHGYQPPPPPQWSPDNGTARSGGNGRGYGSAPARATQPPVYDTTDADLALAMQLQEEEEAEARRQEAAHAAARQAQANQQRQQQDQAQQQQLAAQRVSAGRPSPAQYHAQQAGYMPRAGGQAQVPPPSATEEKSSCVLQ